MIKFIYCLLIFLFFCLITVSCHDISKLKLVLVVSFLFIHFFSIQIKSFKQFINTFNNRNNNKLIDF